MGKEIETHKHTLTQRQRISTPWMSPITVKCCVALYTIPYTIHLSYGYTHNRHVSGVLSVFDKFRLEINKNEKEVESVYESDLIHTKLNNGFWVHLHQSLVFASILPHHCLHSINLFLLYALCVCVFFSLDFNEKKLKKIFLPFDLMPSNWKVNKKK